MTPDILVVDDDHLLVQTLRARLAAEGYQVISASSGLEAVRLFQAFKPRLVILDAAMPDMSGMEVCRQVREVDTQGRTKVLFLTGANTPSSDYVERCALLATADGILRKPYEPAELRSMVARHLSDARCVESVA